MNIGEIKKVEICALAFGCVMEVHFLDENDKYLGNTMVSTNALKRKGIIKRADSFNKAEKWFNSEIGFKWITKHAEVVQ